MHISPFVKPFYAIKGEGIFCIETNLAALGMNLTEGQNVTLQVQFNGGDGDLFQVSSPAA